MCIEQPFFVEALVSQGMDPIIGTLSLLLPQRDNDLVLSPYLLLHSLFFSSVFFFFLFFFSIILISFHRHFIISICPFLFCSLSNVNRSKKISFIHCVTAFVAAASWGDCPKPIPKTPSFHTKHYIPLLYIHV